MRLSLTFFFFLIVLAINAQNREHAFEVNKRLGRGINYGNMFEAPSEQAWGNPWKPEYARMVATLGFKHVRIPIRWEPAERSSATLPYTINPAFLNRIKQAVDSALNNGLHAIINMHHHDSLFANPDLRKARFLAQWKQISVFFKDYPDRLLFELLNEPHGNLTPEKWNIFISDALKTIREDNPSRIVVIGTSEWGGLGGLPYIKLPDDENIILTVHYYNPFQFTHQGASWVGNGTEANAWLGTKWNDSETEREVVQQDFAPLKAFGIKHKIPVHIGEFGAYSKADQKSRVKWTTYLSRYLESLGWSWAYWEFSAGFGIYDPNFRTYKQDLVNALLHNPMPEPARYIGATVYKSNFTATTDGWNLFKQGNAVSSLSRINNSLVVEISNGSTESWHVQLVKNNIQLKAGKKYRYSFKAKAQGSRSFSSYIGMNASPWTAYSGYNNVTVSDTFAVYTFVFDQISNDNTARLAFDFGKSDVDVTISDFLLEEVVLQWPTGTENITGFKTTIFPNPVSDRLHIQNLDNFNEYAILNIQGGILETSLLNKYHNQIDFTKYTPGLYFITLSSENKKLVSKIVKK